jgi:hypothetical protein
MQDPQEKKTVGSWMKSKSQGMRTWRQGAAAAGVVAAAIVALAVAGLQVERPASLMPTDQYAVYHGEGSERGVRARMQGLDAEEAAVTGRPLSIDNGVPQAQLRDEQAAEREVAEEVLHAACSRSRLHAA